MFRTSVLLLVAVLAAGCDAWLKANPNRVQVLTDAAREMTEVLRKVKDEESANQNLPQIETAANTMRELWDKIIAARDKNKGGGMARVTQHKDWNAYKTVIYNVIQQVERIERNDEKAAEIVNEAIDGIYGDGTGTDGGIPF